MRKRRRSTWIRLPVGSAIVIATIAACSSQAPRQDDNIANAIVVNNAEAPESKCIAACLEASEEGS